MKTGIATMTLDTGTCPRWLFERMVKLGREMARVLIEEYGPDELKEPLFLLHFRNAQKTSVNLRF